MAGYVHGQPCLLDSSDNGCAARRRIRVNTYHQTPFCVAFNLLRPLRAEGGLKHCSAGRLHRRLRAAATFILFSAYTQANAKKKRKKTKATGGVVRAMCACKGTCRRLMKSVFKKQKTDHKLSLQVIQCQFCDILGLTIDPVFVGIFRFSVRSLKNRGYHKALA